MQLQSLRLVNFRQHERTELELGPGLLAVVGPNGSGKSTLLEAIAWSLYGTAAARGTKDTIKRRGAPPRAKVEVELRFALGKHNYRLTRTLTNAELTQDGQVIANSTATVTERSTSLLGMTRDEFFNTYFTGQRELAVMGAMTPGERGQFLSRVLGHEKLREAQDRLRVERSERRAQLSGLEQGLADRGEVEGAVSLATQQLDQARHERDAAESELSTARLALATLEPEWQQARERRTAWQGLDGERRVVEGRVLTARTAFQSIDRELAAAADAGRRLGLLAAVLAEWPGLVAEREQLDRAAALVAARSQAVARRDAARERLPILEAESITLPTPETIAELRGALAVATTARETGAVHHAERFTRWKQDEQEARTKLEQFRERYRDLREQHAAITEAGPDGICPYCTRPLGADFGRTLGLLAVQMEEVEASGNYYRQRVEQLGVIPTEIADLDRERLVFDAEVTKRTEALASAEGGAARLLVLARERTVLSEAIAMMESELAGPAANYDAARHETVRARLAALEPERRQHDQLTGLAARAEALVSDAAVAEQTATLAEEALAELDRRLGELDWDPAVFDALEVQVAVASQAIQAAELRVAGSSGAVAAALTLVEAAVARRADRAAKAETARRLGADVERLSELDRAFGDLRGVLNAKMRPDLQVRTADFLGDLTDGRYVDVEITEDYDAAIIEGAEVKPVISGGEEDILNLALRLAISQMIADRAGQPLSLLVLDEIFGSLDESRRQSVLDLLRAIADRFPQVIVITHVEGLPDAFDRVIRLDHDAERGVTTVREVEQEPVDVAY